MNKIIRKVDEKLGIVQITTPDERWYVKEIKNKETGLPEFLYVPSVTWICSFYPKGVQFFKWLASKGWDESQALMHEAGEKGSKVHQAIEFMLQGNDVKMNSKFINKENGLEEELTLEEYECLMSFVSWFNARKPRVIAKETVIFNDIEGYAGTIDLVCELDGKITIIDFKTGQYIWPSYELQLSAYKRASTKVEALAILQLGYNRNKNGYKETPVEDKFDLFLAARQIWKNETEGQKPSQKDYPLELKLVKEVKVEEIEKIKTKKK